MLLTAALIVGVVVLALVFVLALVVGGFGLVFLRSGSLFDGRII